MAVATARCTASRAALGGRQPVERKRRASSWASALPPASRYLLVRRCDQITAQIGHQIADDDRLNVNSFHLCPSEILLLLGLRRQGCGGDWCRLFAACAGGRARVEHGRRDPSVWRASIRLFHSSLPFRTSEAWLRALRDFHPRLRTSSPSAPVIQPISL